MPSPKWMLPLSIAEIMIMVVAWPLSWPRFLILLGLILLLKFGWFLHLKTLMEPEVKE